MSEETQPQRTIDLNLIWDTDAYSTYAKQLREQYPEWYTPDTSPLDVNRKIAALPEQDPNHKLYLDYPVPKQFEDMLIHAPGFTSIDYARRAFDGFIDHIYTDLPELASGREMVELAYAYDELDGGWMGIRMCMKSYRENRKERELQQAAEALG